MGLVNVLSKVVKENLQTKKILLEYPESTVKKLLSKFEKETDDNEDVIRKTISNFERFKGSFATQEKEELKQLNDQLKNLDKSSEEYKELSDRIRSLNKTIQDTLDIFKYDYSALKALTTDKETKQKSKKDFEGMVQDYITKHKGADLQLTKINIKKFFEIKTHMPKLKEFKKDVNSYSPSELNGLVNRYFGKFNNEGLNEFILTIAEKFLKENPDEDVMTAIIPRVKRFVRHFEMIPLNSKLTNFMNFEEFEHLVDGYTPMEESEYDVPEIDTSDVDIAYEDDDVLIFAPDEKHKCINIRKKFAPDRRWCTSWEGSSNYYYNYRLNQNLTLYYVINKKLPTTATDYASVILVDKYGDMRLADGTNSGRFAGSTVIPWKEILIKIPVLKDKQDYFVAKPYTEEDMSKLQRYKTYNLRTTDPISELGNEQEVELWMELRGPDFKNVSYGDEIFGNLPEELQKKYIGLGNELTAGMVRKLSPSAMSYYISKKKEKLLTKSLKDLSENDMEVIMSNYMEPYFKSLKNKFSTELETSFDPSFISIAYPNDTTAKYARLFGLEQVFEIIPKDVLFLQIENKSNDNVIYKIPATIGKFTSLGTLVCDNIIKELPEEIGNCKQLAFLNLTNNKELTTLPASVGKLTCLDFVSVMGSNIQQETLPKEITQYMDVSDDFWEINFPPEMKQHCSAIE